MLIEVKHRRGSRRGGVAPGPSALPTGPDTQTRLARAPTELLPRSLPPAPAWLRGCVESRISEAMANLRPGNRRHTGVHAARRTMRQARAAINLARSDLGAPAKDFERRLKQACRTLSALRDAHATVAAWDRFRGKQKRVEDAALDAQICRVLVARRRRILAESLQRDPDLARLRARLHDLAATVAALPWSNLRLVSIGAGLRRSLRRAGKARHDIRGTNAAARHRWRRRLRLANQQRSIVAALACALFPGKSMPAGKANPLRLPGAKAERQAVRAVRALGREQDLRMLRRAVSSLAIATGPRRRLMRRIERARLDAIGEFDKRR